MLSKWFGKKPASEDLQKSLAQARRALWNDQLLHAEKLFNQVLTEAGNLDQKSAPTDVKSIELQSRLGIWAISYFRQSDQRSKFRQIVGVHVLDDETAYFIAKVFQIKKDTSADALFAYRTLLRLKPTPNLARKLGAMLGRVTASHEALLLLEVVVRIAADTLSFKTQLCRWYLKLGKQSEAQATARQILLVDATNRDAHRCLGYCAEVDGNWNVAIQHYTTSQDWLRVVVTAAKADRLAEASHALMEVEESERSRPTWLYFRGWVAYRQGDFVEAFRAWQQLQSDSGQVNSIDDISKILADQLIYRQLQTLQFDPPPRLEAASSVYRDAWRLAYGAHKLLVERDITGSKPLLRQNADVQNQNFAAATFDALCTAGERNGDDAPIYQQLVKKYGDGSLFLWLRGLLLLESSHPHAYRYLLKAHKEGVFERHLPIEAGRAASWLVMRLSPDSIHAAIPPIATEDVKAALLGQTPFAEAVLPSFVLSAAKGGADGTWLRESPVSRSTSPAWSEVQSVVFAVERQWQRSLNCLQNANEPLKVQILEAAIADAVQRRDWKAAADYVEQSLSVWRDDSVLRRKREKLRPFIRQNLWMQKQLAALDHDLERQIQTQQAPTDVYHQLALVYTQIALRRDQGVANGGVFLMNDHRTQSAYLGILEDQPHNDYWQLAIGYWAVVLTDKEYWQHWMHQRSVIYQEEVTPNHVRELTEVQLPRLLQSYHGEQDAAGMKYAAHHRYYGALILREIELTNAMRYLLRQAEAGRVTVPTEMRRYISPLLIKEYGYEQQARHTVVQSPQLKLSPYEAGLIREAFSPVSDVKALVEVKEYSITLDRLRWLLGQPRYNEFHPEIRQELVRVTHLAADQSLHDEKWDDTYNLAVQGAELQPNDREFEQLMVKASIGWSGQQLRDDSHATAIRRLEQVRAKLRQPAADLNAYLSEVYVEWALQAVNDDDLNLAITRLEKAIAAHSENGRARQLMSAVYADRAVEKAQAEAFREALKDAETALRYQENARSLGLIAMLNRSLAIEAAEHNDFRMANVCWANSRDMAEKHVQLANTQESFDLFAQISLGYVIFLYTRQMYNVALQQGETLFELIDASHALADDLNEVLSAICTDYGAALYNRGERSEGRRLTQIALRYNSSNQAARHNLMNM